MAVVAAAVLADTRLSEPVKLVYCLLAAHANGEDRTTFVGNKTLAALLGRRPEAVSAARAKLREAGWLQSQPRYADGRRRTELTTLRDAGLLSGPGAFGLAALRVLADHSLTPGARVFYARLTTLATREDRDIHWRREAELAQLVGSPRRSSAAEWVKALEDACYLKVERGIGFESRYALNDQEWLPTAGTGAQESESAVTNPVRGIGEGVRETACTPVRQTARQGTDPLNRPPIKSAGSGDAADGDIEVVMQEVSSHLSELADGGDGRRELEHLLEALTRRPRPIHDPRGWLQTVLEGKSYEESRNLVRSLWHTDVNGSDDTHDQELLVTVLSVLDCGGKEDLRDGVMPEGALKLWDLMTDHGIDYPGAYLQKVSGHATSWSGVDAVLANLPLTAAMEDWLFADPVSERRRV